MEVCNRICIWSGIRSALTLLPTSILSCNIDAENRPLHADKLWRSIVTWYKVKVSMIT